MNKSKKKSLIKVFTFIIVATYLCLTPVFLTYQSCGSGPNCLKPSIYKAKAEDNNYNFQVPFSGLENVDPSQGTVAIGQYIKAIYNYAIGVVGILAAIVLMFGGVLWLTAGGNPNRIENAKAWIGGSLTGLILALLSYLILYTLNPSLVNFQTMQPGTVESNKFGCCQYFNSTDDEYRCENKATQDSCQSPQNFQLQNFHVGQQCKDTRCMVIRPEAECNATNLGESCESCGDASCVCVERTLGATPEYKCESCVGEGEMCDQYNPSCCPSLECKPPEGFDINWTCR
jgi:hypothetical protein